LSKIYRGLFFTAVVVSLSIALDVLSPHVDISEDTKFWLRPVIVGLGAGCAIWIMYKIWPAAKVEPPGRS
jgi:hypothetical protein